MLKEARHMLFEHEVYVARFYERRDKWRATAWRLDNALKTYPDFATDPDLVWTMANAYASAGDKVDALRAYAMYVKAFPKGEDRQEAERAIERLTEELRKSEERKEKKEPPKPDAPDNPDGDTESDGKGEHDKTTGEPSDSSPGGAPEEN